MQVVVWIIIILVIFFLIWLLRRWIRRLIFILILLILAFFIYGIFSPSGAARLRYNVRTFPERMASWMGSGKEFLDYNTYKSKIPSIGDSIGDTVDSIGDKIDLVSDSGIGDLGSDVVIDLDSKFDEKEEKSVDKSVEKTTEKDTSSSEKQVIKAFPKSVKFVELPGLEDKTKKENKSEVIGQLTGYSKSDLLGVINRYIEKNLDDDVDILVTVEYEDDSNNPKKIILETQPKSKGNIHSASVSGLSLDELLLGAEGEKVSNTKSSDVVVETPSQQPVKNITSNKLTQKDQQEAEEIFSILF